MRVCLRVSSTETSQHLLHRYVEIATMINQKIPCFFSDTSCAIVFIAYFHLRRYALCPPSGIAICWCSHLAICFRFQALCSSFAIATVAWLSRKDNSVCEESLIISKYALSLSLLLTDIFVLLFLFCVCLYVVVVRVCYPV